MKPIRRERGDGAQQAEKADRLANRRRQLVERFNDNAKFSPRVPSAAQIINPTFVNEAASEAQTIAPHDAAGFAAFLFQRCGFELEPGAPVPLAAVADWWQSRPWRSQIQLEMLSARIHADEQSQPWQISR